MAKITKKFSITKAGLDVDNMQLVEVQKENILTTDLQDVLTQFDGQIVNLSISVDTEVGSVDGEEEEEDGE